MALDEMTCQEIVELVTEYLEATLPASERLRFEAHLRGCRSCQAYLSQLRLTIESAGRLTEEDVPEPVMESLLGAFRRWKPS